MADPKLGKKHTCYQCGCKFYDLNRPAALCPRCGADQSEASKRPKATPPKSSSAAPSSPRRSRRPRLREIDELAGETLPLDDEPPLPFENGLSIIASDHVPDDPLPDDLLSDE